MIIAGLLSHSDKHTFDKLDSIVGNKVCGDRIYLKNNQANIVVGKKTSAIDQGNILSINNCMLVGKVYSKANFNPITINDLEEYTKKPNQIFVDKFWGNYIYIRVTDNNVTILRDPVGQTPLFYTKLDSGECLFSSEIETLIDMKKDNPGFNWKYFSSYALHAFITSEQTAFNQIYELPHGCQISYNLKSRAIDTAIAWNPLDYLEGYMGPEKAMDNIISITSNVIKCWTKNTDIISLDFSGGTDSSSILLLLNRIWKKNKEIKLINRFHPDVSSSDERKWARSLAKELDIPLIEFDHSKSLPYDPIDKTWQFKPNWPTSILSYLKVNNEISSIFEENSNVTYMSGHGGDHIFMCPPPVTSLCDYIIEKGVKGFNTKAMELYAIFREPIFSMVGDILTGIFSYSFYSQYSQSLYAINKIKSAPWFNNKLYQLEKQMRYHPFFYNTNTTKSLPGKFWLIEGIYSGLSTIKTDIRDNGNNPIFFPLFSQPLLELVLSIPTYDSYRHGYNRYLFRKAISDTFHNNTVWRQEKGETSGIDQRGLKRNEKRILELCLDGKMAKEGLVNKEKLHTGILNIINGQTEYQWAVTDIICAETFMNYWD